MRAPAPLALLLLLCSSSLQPARAVSPGFSVVEAGIPDMQRALADGRVTSRQLVEQSLVRIGLYNTRLHAALAVNPRALDEADALDRERATGRLRGPLHGIPIALKDNIQTLDMPTTGGALAFEGFMAPYEATLARNLRQAGAIIVAKTVMTELANWVAGDPTPMPANYSALGGYGLNPYDPRHDPRDGTADGRPALSTGGSSSGIGTAASMWAANVGTETSGSILSPSNQTMLVGIKPTVGRISRYGVIPITADQDTPGPMARSVTDAAIMLGAMEGPRPDPHDPATATCQPPPGGDYTTYLRTDALTGRRIGIPRAYYYDKVHVPGTTEPRGGLRPPQAALMAGVIDVLKQQGAVIVDPVDIPSITSADVQTNLLRWGVCGGADEARGHDDGCSVVLKYGMKRDFNAWLDSLGGAAPLPTLSALRSFNLAHLSRNAIKYGQSLLDISDEMDVARDRPRYESDRARDLALTAATGIDAALARDHLDALLFPGPSGAGIAARPGYPTVIVPAGFVPNEPRQAFPAGFDARPSPYGVSFTAGRCREPALIGMAYAFEQATHRRVPPSLDGAAH